MERKREIARRLFAAAGLSAALLSGCYRWETKHPSGEGISRFEVARVHRDDGMMWTLSEAVVGPASVHGRLVECTGYRDTWQDDRSVPCPTAGALVAIPKDRIHYLETHELNQGATAGAALGALVATALVATAVTVAATSSDSSGGGSGGGSSGGMGDIGSCPRIYSFDGQGWRLDSGTYGSAFYEAGQQTDHDLLERLAAVDGSYRLRLVNELDEIEHVDALRLTVVDHPQGSWVVPTPQGEIVTFVHTQTPLAARDLRGADALERVSQRDGKLWRSDLKGRDPEHQPDTRDGLVLTFPKPRGAKVAKLWLTGTSTRWAGELVRQVMAMQGDRLPDLYRRLNDSVLAQTLLRRLLVDVGLLRVRVLTAEGWTERGLFEAAGNEIAKDQALRIDVADLDGDRLVVRLESAVGMWTIDRVAAGYDAEAPLDVQLLAPADAARADGVDVSAVLSAIDGKRHDAAPGDWVELSFAAPAPPPAGKRRSVVVATTGYDTLAVTPLHDVDPLEARTMLLSSDALSRRSLELLLAGKTPPP